MKVWANGMRVAMKAKAIKQGLDGPKKHRTGTVIDFTPSLYCNGYVRVKRDGEKAAQVWHVDFWKPLL